MVKIVMDKYRREHVMIQNDIEPFSFPFFIVYGWCASIFVLIIEILWHKFNVTVIFVRLRKCLGKFRRIFTETLVQMVQALVQMMQTLVQMVQTLVQMVHFFFRRGT